MEYTYKYIAQSSGVYGSDVYGSDTYSCTESETTCQTQAPNTGFFTAQNTPIVITGFVAVALIASVVTYIVLRKLKKQRG